MAIKNFSNLDPSDLDRTVWRYLTFAKYISLLAYGAVWFSKLNVLVDRYEGAMPTKADEKMLDELRELKRHFHPSLRDQLENANRRNVEDGRELTLVNCWFLGESDTEWMWKQYANWSEGVAI